MKFLLYCVLPSFIIGQEFRTNCNDLIDFKKVICNQMQAAYTNSQVSIGGQNFYLFNFQNPTYQIVPESSSIRPPRPTSTNVRPTNRQNPTQARQPSYQTYPGMYDINSNYGYNPNNFYMPDYDFYMPQYYPQK